MTQGRSSTDRRALPELAEDAAAASSLRATFPVAFERCFGRVYAYVSRRTDDRISLERIVSQVLAANLDLLIDRHDEVEESCRLKRSADRLIAQKSAQRTQSRVVGT